LSGRLNADLLVIGTGVAGCVAAAAAARRGARVVVLDGGASATSMSSGAIDVAAASSTPQADPLAPGPPYAAALEALAAAAPNHPYARIGATGRGRLEEALDLLRSLAVEVDLTGAEQAGQNLVLATALGTTKRAALAQRSIAAGDLAALAGGRVGFLHFEHHYDLDLQAAAATLDAVGREGRGSSWLRASALGVDFLRRARDAQLSTVELARLIDAPHMIAALGLAVEQSLLDAPTFAALLAPPVLGLLAVDEVRAQLEGELGHPLAEICAMPPSVPGWRLDRSLRRGLTRARVEVIKGRVVGTALGGTGAIAIEYLEVGAAMPHTLRARTALLASGHLPASGIVARQDLREPLFDLPLWLDGEHLQRRRARELLGTDYGAAHPLLRIGLATDELLRPLAAEGLAPAHPRLFAAGAILAGNDPTVHQAGLGLCALTGLLAGQAAIAEA